MSKAEIFEKLTDIFRDVFDDEDITLTEATTAADIEDWDSLTHITLLAAVEEEFGVKFGMKAVQNLKNVGELNTLGAVQLGENTALTLDGGFLRLASLQGGARSLLRLTGGAAVLLGDPARSTSASALTVPVVLDGPASLMARASSVRDPGGKALQPFDVVWKTLMPGFHALTSLEIDGQRSRMALTRDHAMRLWLAKGDLSNQGYPAHSLVMRGRDQMGRLRTRYAYLQWDQRTGGFQESEPYPNPFTVTGGEPGEDWVYEEGSHTLRILTSQVSGISGGSGVDADQSPFSGRIVLEDEIGRAHV